MLTEGLHFEVDGTERPVASMLFHAQDEPFPGGHSFVVRLTDDSRFGTVVARIKDLSQASTDRASAQLIFDSLHSEMAFVKGYGRPSRWVLNTVDRITGDANGVTLEGRCSPVKL